MHFKLIILNFKQCKTKSTPLTSTSLRRSCWEKEPHGDMPHVDNAVGEVRK